MDHRLITFVWLVLGVGSIYRGIKDFQHRWEITRNEGFYQITKNEVCVFEGLPSQLAAIKRTPDAYLIYPCKGECFAVPVSEADQTLLELYRDSKSATTHRPTEIFP